MAKGIKTTNHGFPVIVVDVFPVAAHGKAASIVGIETCAANWQLGSGNVIVMDNNVIAIKRHLM